jgi:hypothetical protein
MPGQVRRGPPEHRNKLRVYKITSDVGDGAAFLSNNRGYMIGSGAFYMGLYNPRALR